MWRFMQRRCRLLKVDKLSGDKKEKLYRDDSDFLMDVHITQSTPYFRRETSQASSVGCTSMQVDLIFIRICTKLLGTCTSVHVTIKMSYLVYKGKIHFWVFFGRMLSKQSVKTVNSY